MSIDLSSSIPVRSTRLVPLEACRGIAAFIVLVFHFFLGFSPYTIGFLPEYRRPESLINYPFFVFFNGDGAVAFFFVLSGFVLTHSYFKSPDPLILIRRTIQRLPRLTGLSTLIVLISYACFKLHLYVYPEASELTGSIWLQTLSTIDVPVDYNPTFLQALVAGLLTVLGNSFSYNAALWTMPIEFFASFLVLGFAATIPPYNFLRVFLFCILCFITIGMNVVYIEAFYAGLLLSLLFAKRTITTKLPVALILLLGGLYLLGYVIPSGYYSVFSGAASTITNLALYLNVLGASFVLAAVYSNSRIFTTLNNRFGAYLGKVSFALYLIHMIVIGSTASSVFIVLSPHLPLQATLIITFLYIVAVSFLFATLLAYIDERWMALVNRATDWLLVRVFTH